MLQPGTTLGHYEILEPLAAGGMGEVYVARDRHLDREVAVKVLPESLAENARALERLEREAKILAGVSHPNVLTVHDFSAEDGVRFAVTELLSGEDLGQRLDRDGPLPLAEALPIAIGIGRGLASAHAHKVVHRDIKPANVFLCRYGEDYDFVKVLDFGIAKTLHADHADGPTALTMPNVVHGTPAFIAPEQALGEVDIDARADIYSVGCVAYFLLTGQPVFTGETAMALLLAHAHTPPVLPSSRTELPIPADLEAVVLSCLAKDRDERPSSARDLLARLDAIPLDEPWTQDRARDWWQRHLPSAQGVASRVRAPA